MIQQIQADLIALRARFATTPLPTVLTVPEGKQHVLHPSGRISYSSTVYCFTGPKQSLLDNWSPTPTKISSNTFATAEQLIFLASKAALFADNKSLTLATSSPNMDPKTAKALGRKVGNFKPEVWGPASLWLSDVVVLLKVLQNPAAMDELLSTRGLLIAEGAPRDKLWGIGASCKTVDVALNKEMWRGRNELGKSLVRVREYVLKALEAENVEDIEPIVGQDKWDKFFGWFENGKQKRDREEQSTDNEPVESKKIKL
ncbi:hypothetical protein BCR33DRAFT_857322 [Rhizoclosmatium globosum]|uniref:NADAR domain-containing protein n=1 Tax=Rhizoclosmatium globosum TaxID=329046 RepID=A0A1Y2B8P8_9FUNG|nr:hypothetical protein BCR33DRAFT_857322 [Rhizoclosmatium globosum]|eukprot:ORY30475.1 hypothetical protein BCR33DRAFT_857322 [Rhizoclosmatium globosum]